MAIRCGLFDSTQIVETEYGYPRGDKAQTADFFAKYFSSFVGNGVLYNPSTSFSVMSHSGLTVQIRPGAAFINGYFVFNDETEYKEFTSDTVDHDYYYVLRLDLSEREIAPLWIADPGESQLPIRTELVYDLVIAKVHVGTGFNSITDSMITDLRSDTAYCGFVKSLVDGIGSVVDYANKAGNADFATEAERAGSVDGVITVANGGTGATSPEGARENLGIKSGVAGGFATLGTNAKVTPTEASSYIVTVTAAKTLALTDAGTLQLINSNSSVNLTLSSAVAFPVGTEFEVCRFGAGSASVILSGVKVNGGTDAITVGSQYGCVTFKKVGSTQWIAAGDLG